MKIRPAISEERLTENHQIKITNTIPSMTPLTRGHNNIDLFTLTSPLSKIAEHSTRKFTFHQLQTFLININ